MDTKLKWYEKTKGWVHDENNIKGFFGEYRWLSNFHKCEIYYSGLEFTSSEAAYQSAKCVDIVDKLKFTSMGPNEAKKFGREVNIRPDWNDIKLEVMQRILTYKFLCNPELQIMLINTGEKYLEETNWWNDRFWGVCNGVGDNHLGKILMDLRRFV